MKSKLFLRFLMGIGAVILVHIALLVSGILDFPLRTSLISDGFLFVLFIGGIRGVFTLTEKTSLPFVQAFLLLTTVQLLSMMAMLAAFVFMKVPSAKIMCLQLVTLFVVFLAMQSALLIKWVNQPE